MYLGTRSANRRRRGAFAAWFVMLLPLLATAFALAVGVASSTHNQVELQIGVDAAVLAGANAEQRTTLLDTSTTPGTVLQADVLLTDRSDRVSATATNVRNAALRFAGLHAVAAQPVSLDPNLTNDPNGGIVLGSLDGPTAPFLVADLNASPVDANLYNPFLNALRVSATQSNVSATATVYVDRDVIGFRVNGSSDNRLSPGTPAIPVLPFGILTDFAAGMNRLSWEYNIIRRNGPDAFALSSTGTPTAGPDAIPEITVTISRLTTDNGQMIAVQGSNPTVAVALSQVATGITKAQLLDYDPTNQQLSLFNGMDNQQTLPQLAPTTSSDFQTLTTNLQSILGQPRVWMLYDTPTTTMTSTTVRVVGFVAARVMSVTPLPNNTTPTSVQVVLQPAMMLTSTALTDRAKRNFGPRTVALSTEPTKKTIYNPYIANIRVLK